MKNQSFLIAIAGATLLMSAACAPVSPSIDRNRYNTAKNQPATNPDAGSNKTQKPEEKPTVKSLMIQTAITTQVLTNEKFKETLDALFPSTKDEKKKDEATPPVLLQFPENDPRIQKLANESVTIKGGSTVAKKVTILVAVKKLEKSLKGLNVQAWSLMKEKAMGAQWTLNLDSETSADQKKLLSQEITQVALVITPFSERELAEFASAQAAE